MSSIGRRGSVDLALADCGTGHLAQSASRRSVVSPVADGGCSERCGYAGFTSELGGLEVTPEADEPAADTGDDTTPSATT